MPSTILGNWNSFQFHTMAGPHSPEQTAKSQPHTFLKMWGRSKSKLTGEYFTKMGRGGMQLNILTDIIYTQRLPDIVHKNQRPQDRHVPVIQDHPTIYLYSKTSWQCTQNPRPHRQCTLNQRPHTHVLIIQDHLTIHLYSKTSWQTMYSESKTSQTMYSKSKTSQTIYSESKTSQTMYSESKTPHTCTHNPRPPDDTLVFKDFLTDNVLRIKDLTDNVL